MASQQAGWHPCPSGLDQERYWDGRSWTSSVRPNSSSASYDSRTRQPRMLPNRASYREPPAAAGSRWDRLAPLGRERLASSARTA
jgi:hypothetical protein